MTFLEKTNNGQYSLLIIDLDIVHAAFDPLGRIYSAVRKAFRKCYNIDVVGTFQYIDNEVICNFFLNCAGYETDAEITLAVAKFDEIFQYLMTSLEDVLMTFEDDSETGLAGYNAVAETGDFEAQNEFLENFLLKYNFKQQRSKKSKKATKH